ncbi:4-hydroxy-4-methyl-2-oxoglutarate aldolase/4-carboxy-4-hydroxy-2-oxoadipate aldolase [Streptomyces sp. RB5]|uniref:Putative 4-hydroxy-4-methyl-2-oxoglutarate aldolase n=1 Tax=Streptomyces smaragdinus TaxID=2585196 RepID=A0A7K0CNG5_9ACTN|nr:4-carboxy-4-hydroxy-2-oxoadipate aldolase/oxaloacetate decarboxylase [Streptomyces smaragdinus]MQY14304.1 4-hydroxy-4-methyl-2-oxoglutarate aldolase/4-carboxy-4-hydroxy-2-oxoadipate aldolase [Streptomyces smaragdinus]
MAHVVVVNDQGPDEEIVSVLGESGVATVTEAMGRTGLLDPCIRPIYRGARIAGRAVTVLSQAGDNLMIHAAIEQCRPGDVMVVATMSPSTDGMFGDLLGTALKARGVVGLVIDAGCRDVSDLQEMGFPVWSRAVSAMGTVKATAGSVNVPVVVAGAYVRPGDVIVADDDGVVVVPLELAKETAVLAPQRTESEAEKRDRFQNGELSLDVMNLRTTLTSLGVRYVDEQGQVLPDASPR